MKLRWFILSVLVGACFLHGQPVAAQGEARYADEALQRLSPLLGKANKAKFRMQTGISTIFGGWLSKGTGNGNEPWKEILVLTNADPSQEYRIIAAGDNDCKDLDVRVRVRGTDEIVGSDTGTAPEAEVNFRPTRRQDYIIEFRLYNSDDNCICIGAILHK